MSLRQLPRSRVINVIGGILTVGAGAAGILKLVRLIQQGKGADRYIALSGQEWSAIPALVFVSIALLVLVVGGALRWYFHHREEQHFMATLAERIRRVRRGQWK